MPLFMTYNCFLTVFDSFTQLLPNREEQYDFFTNTFDDEGEEEEKRTSAVKAGIKLESQRRASMAGVSTGDGQQDGDGIQRVSYCQCNNILSEATSIIQSLNINVH